MAIRADVGGDRLAVERTAKTRRKNEQRMSTTDSLGCWVKEFPPQRTASRLWASYRDEIEVGGCTRCVLAATTTAASSAILGCEQTKAKGVDRG
jgi:hypothetical protein